MAQISVSDFPDQAYAGKVHVSGQFPTSTITRLASEAIPFGRAVSALSTTDLTSGNQSCELPNVAADANTPLCLGVAIADVSMEDVSSVGTWSDEDAVAILKTGQIWVEVDTAVAALDEDVCIGIATASGGEGSFDNTASATYIANTSMKWVAYVLIGSTHLGLVQVDL